MRNNIWQVINETHITKILEKNYDKIVVLVFSTSNTKIVPKNENRNLKKYIKRILSKEFSSLIFVYVDIERYEDEEMKYTSEFDNNDLSYILYIWRGSSLGNIKTAQIEDLSDATKQVIEVKNKIIKQEENSEDDDINDIQKELNESLSSDNGITNTSEDDIYLQDIKMKRMEELRNNLLVKEIERAQQSALIKEKERRNNN